MPPLWLCIGNKEIQEIERLSKRTGGNKANETSKSPKGSAADAAANSHAKHSQRLCRVGCEKTALQGEGGIDTYICKKTSPFGTRLFIKSAFIPLLSHEYSQYQRPKLNKGGLTAKKRELQLLGTLSLKKVPLYHHSPTNLRSTGGQS